MRHVDSDEGMGQSNAIATSCLEEAAMRVHCFAFCEVALKYVCDGKRVDEVNEVDRIVVWRTQRGGGGVVIFQRS